MINYKFQEYKALKKANDESKGIIKMINGLKLKVFVNRHSVELLQHSINLSIRDYAWVQKISESAEKSMLVKTINKYKSTK